MPTLKEMEAQAAALPEGAEKQKLVQRVRALRERLDHLSAAMTE